MQGLKKQLTLALLTMIFLPVSLISSPSIPLEKPSRKKERGVRPCIDLLHNINQAVIAKRRPLEMHEKLASNNLKIAPKGESVFQFVPAARKADTHKRQSKENRQQSTSPNLDKFVADRGHKAESRVHEDSTRKGVNFESSFGRRFPKVSTRVDTMIFNLKTGEMRGMNQMEIPFIADRDIVKVYKPQSLSYLDPAQKIDVYYTKNRKAVIQQQSARGCTAAVTAMLIKDAGGQPDLQSLRETNLGNTQTKEADLRKAGLKPKTTRIEGGTPEEKVVKIFDLIEENGSAIIGVDDFSSIGGHAIIVDEIALDRGIARIRDPYHGWEIAIRLDKLIKLISATQNMDVIQVVN